MSNVSSPSLLVIDVGHGNGAVLFGRGFGGDAPPEDVFVFDAGGSEGSLAVRATLKKAGVRQIEALVGSHLDRDHLGGLTEILKDKRFRCERVRLNTDPGKLGAANVKRFLRALMIAEDRRPEGERRSDPISRIEPIHRSIGEIAAGAATIEVLHPGDRDDWRRLAGRIGEARRLQANSMSVVLRIWAGEDRSDGVLLAGDIDEPGLELLSAREKDLRAKILVWPHHGGKSNAAGDDDKAFAKKLCDLVRPERVVFSIARSTAGIGVNPRLEILDGVRESARPPAIACTQLSGHCHKGEPPSVADHLAGFPASGSGTNSCCAGTIRIDLAPECRVAAPDDGKHRDFVRSRVPGAKCVAAPQYFAVPGST